MATTASRVQEHPAITHLRGTVLPEVTREAIRAHVKHGEASLLDQPDARLAHLVEEVGEVARALSEKDQARAHGRGSLVATQLRSDLREELIQVAHIAAAWAACLDLE